ncbi:amino acid transporter [Saccharata proteae CBS 121410]|uniref:Amino acid transporter n=1 Tax=Saccharata proteae CBS 121410 TaxID=1314787 RepID=A0A9P4HSH1_9PEZI|nr:amino acid transporter [Saccharata proteae CBS 121410]
MDSITSIGQEPKYRKDANALDPRSSFGTGQSNYPTETVREKGRTGQIDDLEHNGGPSPHQHASQGGVDLEENPFGHEDANAEIKYQTMEWWHAGSLMIAETISLGVLSLPAAVATLGLFPGILLMIVLGGISTYTGYIIGQFYLAFPGIHTYADAAQLLGGRWAKEIMGVSQCLLLVFIMAAHVLSFSIMMNVLTEHGTCSIVFGFLGFAVSLALALKRQMEKVAWLSVASCVSVIVAVTVAIVGIAIEKPDAGNVVSVNHSTTLQTGMIAALQIILAFFGHAAFFTFCTEMKNPRDFPKALVMMFTLAMIFYTTVGVVIYYYAGPSVLSPALGSASPLISKIAFGLAAPTIVIAGVVNGHIACKYIWVRIWRSRPGAMNQKWGGPFWSWIAICSTLWLLSWVIAEAIPSFHLLLGFISALFCGWFNYSLPSTFWLYMNRGKLWSTKTKAFLTVSNVLIWVMGAAICGLGLWASGTALAEGDGGASFSCANNYNP